MLTNGDTITVGDVVYTWDDTQKAWITPAPPIPAEDVIYQQELITPAIRPKPASEPANAADQTEPDPQA